MYLDSAFAHSVTWVALLSVFGLDIMMSLIGAISAIGFIDGTTIPALIGVFSEGKSIQQSVYIAVGPSHLLAVFGMVLGRIVFPLLTRSVFRVNLIPDFQRGPRRTNDVCWLQSNDLRGRHTPSRKAGGRVAASEQ